MGLGLKRGDHWIYIGVFCDRHIAHVGKVYGTVKVEAVSKDNAELDMRCSIDGCKEYVSFTVEKKAW